MNIQTYISSGVLECYVSGLISPEEEAELDQIRMLYPEVNTQIEELECQLEKYLTTHPVIPSAMVKSKVMEMLQEEGGQVMKIKHREENKHPEAPPALNFQIHIGWKMVLITLLGIIVTSLLAVLLFYYQLMKHK